VFLSEVLSGKISVPFTVMKKLVHIVLIMSLLLFSVSCSGRGSSPEDYLEALGAFDRGDYSEAIRLMSAYGEANPGLAVPRYWLGLMEFAEDDIGGARKQFEKALAIAPNFGPALERLGYLELSVGNIKAAREMYARLAELEPDSADACFRLALTEILLFDNESSVRHFEKALEKKPSHLPAAMMAMFPLQYLDDLEGAERVLELACKAKPDSVVVQLLRARNKQLLGKMKEAESLYLQAMKTDPGYSKTPMELANRIYIPSGEYDKAARMLRRAIELEPARNSNRLDLGFLLFIMGRHRQAEEVFREALEHAPSSFEAYFGLAKIEVDRRNREKARQYLAKALELNPGYERAGMLMRALSLKPGEEGSRRR